VDFVHLFPIYFYIISLFYCICSYCPSSSRLPSSDVVLVVCGTRRQTKWLRQRIRMLVREEVTVEFECMLRRKSHFSLSSPSLRPGFSLLCGRRVRRLPVLSPYTPSLSPIASRPLAHLCPFCIKRVVYVLCPTMLDAPSIRH